MDRAGAIKQLEWIRMLSVKPDNVDAYDMAIAALREQEQREQGCEYCTTEHDILLPTDMGYTWISGKELQNSYGSCEIRFCPMCGRKLTEPPKEGAEG